MCRGVEQDGERVGTRLLMDGVLEERIYVQESVGCGGLLA